MSWRLLAEVRDRDFAPLVEACRARRNTAGEPDPLPFNGVHGKLLMLLLAEWSNDHGAAVYPRSKAAFASACVSRRDRSSACSQVWSAPVWLRSTAMPMRRPRRPDTIASTPCGWPLCP